MSDIKYIIKKVIIGVLISVILMLIGSLKVKASTLIDLDLGNVVSFSCNNSWNIFETANQSSGQYLRQVRQSMGCYIKRPGSDYNLIVFQPSFNLQYTNQFSNGDLSPYIYYNNSSLSYNTRVFLTYNNKTRYCQQEYTYAICDIDDITPDIDQYIAITIGFDFAFSSMSINANQLINGNMSISPLIQYAKLKDSTKGSLSVIDDSINRMNDTIKDDSAPSTNEVGSNSSSWASNNANNGVINQLVQLPITLLNSVVNGLNSSCSPYNFGSLFDTDLIFPCVNMQQVVGVALWTTIDLIISGIFVFKFGSKLVQIFNNFTNLKGGQVDQLYGGGN